MTLEDLTTDRLLNMSAEDLKKISDDEFIKLYAEKYLRITRPEQAEKPAHKNTVRILGDTQSLRQKKFNLASDLAKQLGIDLDLSDL